MNDDELRGLVRAAVARHLGPRAVSPPDEPAARIPNPMPSGAHASHYLYVTLVNTGEACVIEPSVTCDHCGYCKSHGH